MRLFRFPPQPEGVAGSFLFVRRLRGLRGCDPVLLARPSAEIEEPAAFGAEGTEAVFHAPFDAASALRTGNDFGFAFLSHAVPVVPFTYRLQKVSSNGTSCSVARARSALPKLMKRTLSAYLLALISGTQV